MLLTEVETIRLENLRKLSSTSFSGDTEEKETRKTGIKKYKDKQNKLINENLKNYCFNRISF